jgi:uncharacterized protein YcbK (DUF882 family)
MKYFNLNEFTCKCGCQKALMSEEFLQRLDALRGVFGKPMVVTSGYRCPKHNAKVSTTGSNGPHTTGNAVDIAASGTDAYNLAYLAIKFGFTGIGVRQNGPHEARFLHLDTLEGNTRPWLWTY